MVTLRKNRKIISPSVSLDVAAYLKFLPTCKINASQEVDDAVKATPGFKKFIKNQNEETLEGIGWESLFTGYRSAGG